MRPDDYESRECSRKLSPSCTLTVQVSKSYRGGAMCKNCRRMANREYTKRWREGNGAEYEKKRKKSLKSDKVALEKRPPKLCSCCGRREVYRSRDGMIQHWYLCRECYLYGEDRQTMW